jgi:hypothetical protein
MTSCRVLALAAHGSEGRAQNRLSGARFAPRTPTGARLPLLATIYSYKAGLFFYLLPR